MLETNATMSVMSTVESLANMEAGAGDTARLILRIEEVVARLVHVMDKYLIFTRVIRSARTISIGSVCMSVTLIDSDTLKHTFKHIKHNNA